MIKMNVNEAWSKLFEKYDILNKIQSEGAFFITANQIKELVDKFDYSLDEIAVLYRANAQSRAIEDAFVLKDMP